MSHIMLKKKERPYIRGLDSPCKVAQKPCHFHHFCFGEGDHCSHATRCGVQCRASIRRILADTSLASILTLTRSKGKERRLVVFSIMPLRVHQVGVSWAVAGEDSACDCASLTQTLLRLTFGWCCIQAPPAIGFATANGGGLLAKAMACKCFEFHTSSGSMPKRIHND